MDIVIRDFDGRVQSAAETIVLKDDRYLVINGGAVSQEPLNAFQHPTTLVKDLANVPADLIGGWTHDFRDGTFTPTGRRPPNYDPDNGWKGRAPLSPLWFSMIIGATLGNACVGLLITEPAHREAWNDLIVGTIDPNEFAPGGRENLFQATLTFWLNAKGRDGAPLLTPDQVETLRKEWPLSANNGGPGAFV